VGVLILSSRVTDSRTLNLVLHTYLIRFSDFSIVFPIINYGGDSSVLSKFKIFYLFKIAVLFATTSIRAFSN